MQYRVREPRPLLVQASLDGQSRGGYVTPGAWPGLERVGGPRTVSFGLALKRFVSPEPVARSHPVLERLASRSIRNAPQY
jgi:hypothetical protein